MTTTSASPLDRPVQYLKGVGPKRAEIFARMGVDTARDLLYHVPRRYEDASTVTPIRSLEVGIDATVIGEVTSKGVIPTRVGLRPSSRPRSPPGPSSRRWSSTPQRSSRSATVGRGP